jgi:hypothetical protein
VPRTEAPQVKVGDAVVSTLEPRADRGNQVLMIPLPERISLPKKRGGKNAGHFKKGHAPLPGAGRPKGSQDGMTREIKQALLDAVERVGDRKAYDAAILAAQAVAAEQQKKFDATQVRIDGSRGVTAYLEWIAQEYPQVACAMLAHLQPFSNGRPRDFALIGRRVMKISFGLVMAYQFPS